LTDATELRIVNLMQLGDLLEKLRLKKKKITKVRKAVVEIVLDSGPVSVPKILKELAKKKILVNKTTVYREISFLLSQGLVKEISISPHITHYEFALSNHHHHLICQKCGQMKEVVCKELEGSMERLEKRVSKNGFCIKKHNLEFFGLCAKCH